MLGATAAVAVLVLSAPLSAPLAHAASTSTCFTPGEPNNTGKVSKYTERVVQDRDKLPERFTLCTHMYSFDLHV